MSRYEFCDNRAENKTIDIEIKHFSDDTSFGSQQYTDERVLLSCPNICDRCSHLTLGNQVNMF